MPQGDKPNSAAKPRIVAGMPMYNEEETIGSVVIRALRHVDEVICIDDGSSDASARIAEACNAIGMDSAKAPSNAYLGLRPRRL